MRKVTTSFNIVASDAAALNASGLSDEPGIQRLADRRQVSTAKKGRDQIPALPANKLCVLSRQ
jgi:hypothetical protein